MALTSRGIGNTHQDSNMCIDPNVAKTIAEKSNQDLIAILENPEEWMPPVVEFARTELGRRSISEDKLNRVLAANAKHRANDLQQKSKQRLTFWEMFWATLPGVGIGLAGLIFVIPQSSRFKSNGFLLKAKQSWRLFWLGFAIHAVCVLVYFCW